MIFLKKFTKLLSVALSGIILVLSSVISVNADGDKKYVYTGGQAFGVKLYSDGVMVTSLESYFDGTKYVCPAKDSGLEESDIIKLADGESVETNEEMRSIITSSDGESIELTVERDDSTFTTEITPVKNTAGMYLIGAWIRDSCAGIGTITYYDEESGTFAALGHGICDTDTQALVPSAGGEIVKAGISGVTKSVSGKAGSLSGYFTDYVIGTLGENTEMGIYGEVTDNSVFTTKAELGENSDIKTGDVQIITSAIDGVPKYYDAEITRICNMSDSSNENFVIKITDEKLIETCGGIVQGMSGSPIIQNNKLIGAITHVFIDNPCEGYGVAIQNMASKNNN